MRIALFTDSDVFAGTEQHILDLARGLRELKFEVLLACPSPSALADRAAQDQIGVIAISKGGALDWRAVRTLARMLSDNRVDIIHAHNGRTSVLAALAVAVARKGDFVATQHFLHPASTARAGPQALLSSWLHRWVGRRAGNWIAVSQAARREMLARGDAPDERINVIAHGVIPAKPPDDDEKRQARAALGIGTDVPMVLCAARLEPEKGIVFLVRAMARVAREIPQALCVIAGEGSQRAVLKAEVARLGLTGQVRFLGFSRQMTELIVACDVLVLPSLAEPFGLVLLEAMAHARAVIATRAGGPPDIVRDGETGLLVGPGDQDELAQGIVKVLKDSQMRGEMGLLGWNRARECFSLCAMAQATGGVYAAALERRRTSPGLI